MKPFEIWMDHENLKYFREPYKLNRQQARWYLKLQDYNFTLWHIPGKINTKVDILLRKDQVETKEDNKDVQMLKKELWTRRTTAKVTIIRNRMTDNMNILKEIQKNGTRKWEVDQALKKEDRLSWEQGRIMYMEGWIYIPNNKKLKKKILWKNHDLVDMEHSRQQRIMELIKQNYW